MKNITEILKRIDQIDKTISLSEEPRDKRNLLKRKAALLKYAGKNKESLEVLNIAKQFSENTVGTTVIDNFKEKKDDIDLKVYLNLEDINVLLKIYPKDPDLYFAKYSKLTSNINCIDLMRPHTIDELNALDYDTIVSVIEQYMKIYKNAIKYLKVASEYEPSNILYKDLLEKSSLFPEIMQKIKSLHKKISEENITPFIPDITKQLTEILIDVKVIEKTKKTKNIAVDTLYFLLHIDIKRFLLYLIYKDISQLEKLNPKNYRLLVLKLFLLEEIFPDLKYQLEIIPDYKYYLQLLDTILTLSPENKKILKLRANRYEQIEDYHTAISDYQKVLSLGEKTEDVFKSLGNAYFKIKDYQKSIEYYSNLIQLTEKELSVYYLRGLSYFYYEDYINALDDFKKCQDLIDKNSIDKKEFSGLDTTSLRELITTLDEKDIFYYNASIIYQIICLLKLGDEKETSKIISNILFIFSYNRIIPPFKSLILEWSPSQLIKYINSEIIKKHLTVDTFIYPKIFELIKFLSYFEQGSFEQASKILVEKDFFGQNIEKGWLLRSIEKEFNKLVRNPHSFDQAEFNIITIKLKHNSIHLIIYDILNQWYYEKSAKYKDIIKILTEIRIELLTEISRLESEKQKSELLRIEKGYRKEKERMIQQYSHTLANTLYPNTIYEVANRLKEHIEFRHDAKILTVAYHAETVIKNQGLLLQARNTGNPMEFQQLIRSDRLKSDTSESAIKVREIINNALERILARFLNSEYHKIDKIRKAICKIKKADIEFLKDSYEEEVFFGEQKTVVAWANEHIGTISIQQSELWQAVRLRQDSYAEALLQGFFSEIFLNALKYHNPAEGIWTKIRLYNKEIENTEFLVAEWSNPFKDNTSIGTGQGLHGIRNDLNMLNDQLADSPDLDIIQSDNHFSVSLYFQKDLLIPYQRKIKFDDNILSKHLKDRSVK